MPELFRLLARNCLIGVAAGWTTLALLLLTNTARLGELVANAANPVLPVLLLGAGFTITFGSIAMGVAIMTMPYEGRPGKGRGFRVLSLPALLRAQRRGKAEAGELMPIRLRGRGEEAAHRG